MKNTMECVFTGVDEWEYHCRSCGYVSMFMGRNCPNCIKKTGPETKNEIPRRADINRYIPEEKAIREVILLIEGLGAHELLTKAVMLLTEAKDKLADWVDIQ